MAPGRSARSSTTTRLPSAPASAAHISPAAPPPRMITSAAGGRGMTRTSCDGVATTRCRSATRRLGSGGAVCQTAVSRTWAMEGGTAMSTRIDRGAARPSGAPAGGAGADPGGRWRARRTDRGGRQRRGAVVLPPRLHRAALGVLHGGGGRRAGAGRAVAWGLFSTGAGHGGVEPPRARLRGRLSAATVASWAGVASAGTRRSTTSPPISPTRPSSPSCRCAPTISRRCPTATIPRWPRCPLSTASTRSSAEPIRR